MRVYLKLEILSSPFRSQRRLAMACGKSDDWLSKIIIGRKDPSDEDKEMILSKLNSKNPDKLFMNIDD